MANLSAFGGAQPITPGGLVELGYADSDANLAITATTAAGMDNISPELTVVCDGGPIMVEFFCAGARATIDASGTSDALSFALKVDGSVEEERLGTVGNVSSGYGSLTPIKLSHRLTPTAGSHTFRIGGWVTNASRSGYIGGGTPYPPSWIRVSKIVQQNDGLKPFWTPPLVTQLPSNPTVGDTVIYAADATNGIYWNLYYDGIGSYPWKYVGGPPLHDFTNSGFGFTSTSFTTDTVYTGYTIPLAGDYTVETTVLGYNTTAFQWWLWKPNGCSYPAADEYGARVSQANNGNYEVASTIQQVTLTTGTLNAVARVVGATGQVADRSITATPIRVA